MLNRLFLLLLGAIAVCSLIGCGSSGAELARTKADLVRAQAKLAITRSDKATLTAKLREAEQQLAQIKKPQPKTNVPSKEYRAELRALYALARKSHEDYNRLRAANVTKEDAKKLVEKEKGRLQGLWKVLSIEENGKRVDRLRTKENTFHFAGDTLVCKGNYFDVPFENGKGVKEQKASYHIDPIQEPKAITFKPLSGGRRSFGPAIYRFREDKLEICIRYHNPGVIGSRRPMEFRTRALQPDSIRDLFGELSCYLFVLERVK